MLSPACDKPSTGDLFLKRLGIRKSKQVKNVVVRPQSSRICPQPADSTPKEGKPEGKPSPATSEGIEDDEPVGYTVVDKVTVDKWYLAEVQSLGMLFGGDTLKYNNMVASQRNDGKRTVYHHPIEKEEDEYVIYRMSYPKICKMFLRGGPRKFCHFEPTSVRAAVVTCGGLCPGLNNVIREVVHTLYSNYGVDDVYGIRGGFNGFFDPSLKPIKLDLSYVDSIHHFGGTVLGSSRGGLDLEKIICFLQTNNVNQLYIIGGDGTHRAAHKIAMECINQGLNVSVAGIPKTIDNDVDIIDRSFGFQTAVEAAQIAISSAKVEAQCNIPRGIGIVKLMGRSSGYIAAHATLSAADVDVCLIPEVPIIMEGEKGILPHLERVIADKGHAVVVVAEGAGEELLGRSAEVDAGGNRKLPQVGTWIKAEIEKYFSAQSKPATVKYIDPSYMIRSVPANAADSFYCSVLAQNAVHGAMAGFTAFSVGMINNQVAYIPIPLLTATSPRMMDPRGRVWEQVLSLTRQPNTVAPLTTEVRLIEEGRRLSMQLSARMH